MEDMDRYNEISDQISGMETFFDVFQVITKHGLLEEVKNTSISYLLSEVGERLEIIKKLNEESYNRLKELKKLAGVTN